MESNIYDLTIQHLFSVADQKYKNFSEKIANSKKPMIGVQIPKLRKIADDIFKKGYNEYLINCKFLYFEDTLIYGLVISKLDYANFITKFDFYLNNVDSWSHIDSFVPSIKSIKKYKEEFWDLINLRIRKAKDFTLRFYIICLMDFYLDEKHLSCVFNFCEMYDGNGYYNDMAIAWLISVAFVKFRSMTFEFIKNSKLSNFTLNKSISKIRDSFRVTKEDKILLQNFIRKK